MAVKSAAAGKRAGKAPGRAAPTPKKPTKAEREARAYKQYLAEIDARTAHVSDADRERYAALCRARAEESPPWKEHIREMAMLVGQVSGDASFELLPIVRVLVSLLEEANREYAAWEKQEHEFADSIGVSPGDLWHIRHPRK